MKLPEAFRAYMLLDAANIPEENEKLARATLDYRTYDNMKAKLLRIFGDNSDVNERAPEVKIEPADVYYTRPGNSSNHFSGKSHQQRRRGRARAGYRGK